MKKTTVKCLIVVFALFGPVLTYAQFLPDFDFVGASNPNRNTDFDHNFFLNAGSAIAKIGGGLRATGSNLYIFSQGNGAIPTSAWNNPSYYNETLSMNLNLSATTVNSPIGIVSRIDEVTGSGILAYAMFSNSNQSLTLSLRYGKNVGSANIDGVEFGNAVFALDTPYGVGADNSFQLRLAQDDANFKLELIRIHDSELIGAIDWVALPEEVAGNYANAGAIGFLTRVGGGSHGVTIQSFSAIPEPAQASAIVLLLMFGGLVYRSYRNRK